jgi:hypothetical protein
VEKTDNKALSIWTLVCRKTDNKVLLARLVLAIVLSFTRLRDAVPDEIARCDWHGLLLQSSMPHPKTELLRDTGLSWTDGSAAR